MSSDLWFKYQVAGNESFQDVSTNLANRLPAAQAQAACEKFAVSTG